MNVKTKSGGAPASEQGSITPVQEQATENPIQPIAGVVKPVREVLPSGNDIYAQTRTYIKILLENDLFKVDTNSLALLYPQNKQNESVSDVVSGNCSGIPCLMFPAVLSQTGYMLLGYGVNNLQLISVQAAEDIKAPVRITLRDFQLFGPLPVVPVTSSQGSVTGSTLRPLVSNLTAVAPVSQNTIPAESLFIGSWQEQIEFP